MQKHITLILTIFIALQAKAQVDFITYEKRTGKIDTIYTIAETSPHYWNGNDVFFEELVQSLTYPPLERERKNNATISMMFTVTKDAQNKDLDIIEKTNYPSLDFDALLAVETFLSKGKTFIPATVKNRNVNAVLAFDVIFKCDSKRNIKDFGTYFVNSSIDTIIINDLETNALYKKIISKKDTTYLQMDMNKLASDNSNSVTENAAADVPSSFPGGQDALMKYLSENVKYPAEARENNIQGRVVVKFIVETDGSISNVLVLKKVHDLLDGEAVRLAKSMPKWIPGVNDNRKIRCYFTMPVSFKLEG